jgi:hypothetical protein
MRMLVGSYPVQRLRKIPIKATLIDPPEDRTAYEFSTGNGYYLGGMGGRLPARH